MANQTSNILNLVVSKLLEDPVTTMALLIQADDLLPGTFELIMTAVLLADPDTLNSALQTVQELAQSGDDTATQVMQILQTKMGLQDSNLLAMAQLVAAARYGAKLLYIKLLLGICPEGYEMAYFKAGGRVCSKCMKKKTQKDCGGARVAMAKCGRKVAKGAKGFVEARARKMDNGGKYDADLIAGRKPIIEKGVVYYMNGDGKLVNAALLHEPYKSNRDKLNEKIDASIKRSIKNLKKTDYAMSKKELREKNTPLLLANLKVTDKAIMDADKCGGTIKKKKMNCGGKSPKKHLNGGTINLF